MADWLLLLPLLALGLGGYCLMGRLGDYLADNLARNAVSSRPVEGWTPQTFSFIIGKKDKKAAKGGDVHGSDASAAPSAGTTRGCAG